MESAIHWSVKWRQSGDHAYEHVMYENTMPVMFKTRREARGWIDKHYGYIRGRKDLKSAPHFWNIPIPIRVKVVEIKTKGAKSECTQR